MGVSITYIANCCVNVCFCNEKNEIERKPSCSFSMGKGTNRHYVNMLPAMLSCKSVLYYLCHTKHRDLFTVRTSQKE